MKSAQAWIVLCALFLWALAGLGLSSNPRPTRGVVLDGAPTRGEDPQAPARKGRKTIVVDGFEVAAGAVQLDGPATGVNDLLQDLRRQLETRLVQADKLSVLKRPDPPPVQKAEPRSELPLDGTRQGPTPPIDYRVACRVERLYVHTEAEVVQLTGYVSRTRVAELRMSLTLTSGDAGVIEWVQPYTESYEWQNQDLLLEHPPLEAGALGRALLEQATEALATGLLRHLFPPRVMRVDLDGAGGITFYLNVGSELYGIGDKFELILPGEPLLDSDTGAVIGHVEQPMGVLRILRQDERSSQAQLILPSEAQEQWIASEEFDPERLECRALPKE